MKIILLDYQNKYDAQANEQKIFWQQLAWVSYIIILMV